MRRSHLHPLALLLLLPAAALAQSWMGGSPPPLPRAAPPERATPEPEQTTLLVALGSVSGDGVAALEVISLNGSTRARQRGGRLEVWGTMSAAPPQRLASHLPGVTALALDRSGKRVATADAAGKLQVWAWRATRRPIYQRSFPDPVQRIEFQDRQGEALLVHTEGGTPTVIDLSDW